MDDILYKFRKKIMIGETVCGLFMKTGDAMFAEAAGFAGFDFAIFDMEHGPASLENQQNNIRASVLSGMLPIVRVKDCNENTIGSALDIGAMGIQVPQVKSAEQARKAIECAKFYPKGMRGVCRFVRAAQYSSMDRYDYFKKANDTIVILQLEGVDAINNLDNILEIDNVDVLFVGPYDLSQSMGIPGQIDSPEVISKMKEIVSKVRKKKKIVGTFVDDSQMLKLWKDIGIQYLSYSVDVGIFMDECKRIVSLTKNI